MTEHETQEQRPQEQRPQENPESAERAGKAATADLLPRPNFVLNQPEGTAPPDMQAQPATQTETGAPPTTDAPAATGEGD